MSKLKSDNDCRLYNLENKNLLAEILGINRKTLLKIDKNANSYYNVFSIYKNNNPREIQEPRGILRKIHHCFKCKLSDLTLSHYLYSGRKKLSYVDNARVHLNKGYLVKMDISQFYPSCTREFIFKFFSSRLKMPNDIAEICTNLTTYNRHIPTGSPVSQILAFHIHKDVFDNAAVFAKKNNMAFTLYVDDLSFSTNNHISSSKIVSYINAELRKRNLKLKRKKIISYKPNDNKIVTGCVLTNDGSLKAPHRLKRDLFQTIRKKKIEDLDVETTRVLLGKLQAIHQIEGSHKFTNLQHSLKKHLSKIVKK